MPGRSRAGRRDTSVHGPGGKRRSRGGRRCKARTGQTDRATFAASPSRPTQSRSRRTAAEKVRPAGAARPGRGPPRGIHRFRVADHAAGLSPPGRLRGPHQFTSQRFHALLNSLFKVLFNFPSRYLSAIGLTPVFSLRWSLPPRFGLHSQATRLRRDGAPGRRGPLPASHRPRAEPLSEGLRPPTDTRATAVSCTPQFPRPPRAGIRRWALPSSLAATEGILVSFFSSA